MKKSAFCWFNLIKIADMLIFCLPPFHFILFHPTTINHQIPKAASSLFTLSLTTYCRLRPPLASSVFLFASPPLSSFPSLSCLLLSLPSFASFLPFSSSSSAIRILISFVFRFHAGSQLPIYSWCSQSHAILRRRVSISQVRLRLRLLLLFQFLYLLLEFPSLPSCLFPTSISPFSVVVFVSFY